MLSPAAASAATPDHATLSDADAPVKWSGNPVSQGEDRFRFDLSLPSGTWNTPGGVQVAIHWPYKSREPDDRQDLDLYVYDKDGNQVASSHEADEDTESVWLTNAVNGTYWVSTYGYKSRGYPYEGRVEVERPPAAQPVRDLLPDLVVRPQTHVTFPGTRRVYADQPDSQLVNGCHKEEGDENHALRCLRFDQIVANFGAGPAEVRYSTADMGTTQTIYQRIHRSDGSWRDRPASRYEYHATHKHFHYAGFARSYLWRSDQGGARLGEAPIRSGKKNGFCLIDVLDVWFAQKGDAGRLFTADGCVTADDIPSGREAVNGISVGWADVYNWWLPDQYIDVEGVGDGYYQIETVVDPDNTLVESDDANNSGVVAMQICGEKVEMAGGDDVCPGPPPRLQGTQPPPPTQYPPASPDVSRSSGTSEGGEAARVSAPSKPARSAPRPRRRVRARCRRRAAKRNAKKHRARRAGRCRRAHRRGRRRAR